MNKKRRAEMMRLIGIIFSAILAAGCTAHTSSISQLLQPSPTCQNCGYVIDGYAARILDGDTIDLVSETSTTFRIRLKGIDAPEKSQPFGLEAKAHLTKLIGTRQLHIIWSKKDQYGRLIGKVESPDPNREDLCLKMIQDGYAWHYKQFENEQSAEDRTAYALAEKTARTARRGLWNTTSTPTPPWEYRHQTITKDISMSDNNGHNNDTRSDEDRVNSTLRDMAESAFFQELTDLALIRYIRESPALADDPGIFELITRLNPAWQIDLSTQDAAPTYISITLPLRVAKDSVAYDHCRCIEAGVTAENMQPCTYCALKLAIFKGTGDELYRPLPTT